MLKGERVWIILYSNRREHTHAGVVKLVYTATCLIAFERACYKEVAAITRLRVRIPPPVLCCFCQVRIGSVHTRVSFIGNATPTGQNTGTASSLSNLTKNSAESSFFIGRPPSLIHWRCSICHSQTSYFASGLHWRTITREPTAVARCLAISRASAKDVTRRDTMTCFETLFTHSTSYSML